MSPDSLFDAKEQVRQAIDIVDLVGGYIQLSRQGRIYVGLCPWHDDTKPSLQVNPERQSFKCWVCDIGGDIFSFIMQMEGVAFPEALKMLAERAGIQLKPTQQRKTDGPAGSVDKQTLYRAMAWAESQYHECLLHAPEAEPARRYLQQRNIPTEIARQFHLGFSPEQRGWLLGRAEQAKQAGRTEFILKTLETIGLLARPEGGGSVYDRFRGRVLFSIRDVQGRPVGFGGRLLPDSGVTSPAKYINSPETPLFSKSNLLYGLDVARQSMRKSRTALVMEGYTDCIAAHQYGFGDAVAVLGTALGEGHIRILKRFADRIVLVLDGDEAGQRRANEVLELFVAQQVDLRILTLPEETDPCDFLQEHGAEAFADLLATKAVDALEHAFSAATRGVDLERDVHRSSQALERLVGIVAKAPRLRADTTREDRFREEKILQRLAASFRVPEKDVRDRLTVLRRASRRRAATVSAYAPSAYAPPANGPPVDGPPSDMPPMAEPDGSEPPERETIDPWQRELLELLVQHPELASAAREQINPQDLTTGRCGRIYGAICSLSESDVTPAFDRLMLQFDDAATKNLLVELDESDRVKGIADPEALLQELIKSYQKRRVDKQHPANVATLREEGLDESQKEKLFHKMLGELRARHGISGPTDG